LDEKTGAKVVCIPCSVWPQRTGSSPTFLFRPREHAANTAPTLQQHYTRTSSFGKNLDENARQAVPDPRGSSALPLMHPPATNLVGPLGLARSRGLVTLVRLCISRGQGWRPYCCPCHVSLGERETSTSEAEREPEGDITSVHLFVFPTAVGLE
jgi:hypothetical protein